MAEDAACPAATAASVTIEAPSETTSTTNMQTNTTGNSGNAFSRLASVIASKVSLSSSLSVDSSTSSSTAQIASEGGSPKVKSKSPSPSRVRLFLGRSASTATEPARTPSPLLITPASPPPTTTSTTTTTAPNSTGGSLSPSSDATTTTTSASTSRSTPAGNTLTVPGSFLGAIPRHQTSTDSELSTPSSSEPPTRSCFCGYYSEVLSADRGGKKPGRCKFCRSKAKYIPGQRSFDASRLFGSGRRRERAEPRRAVSTEDRRSDGQTTEDTSASTSSATTAQSSFDRPSFFSTPPFLRRQERLHQPPSDMDFSAANVPGGLHSPSSASSHLAVHPPRDHGLRTPPAPPPLGRLRAMSPRMEEGVSPEDVAIQLSHRMAHEMPEYLVPPPRTTAILGRAQTDPASAAFTTATSAVPYEQPPSSSSNAAAGAFSGIPSIVRHPLSPPPAYSEVIKEDSTSPRLAPPSYEEALSARMADLRMSQAVQQHHRGQHLHFGSGVRSLSEERTMATGGTATTSTMMSGTAAAAGATASAATAGMASASATSTPYRARGGNRPLLRSSRAEEIPDIYWEQAARELDFCTCRKCQARYRQYFEEDPDAAVAAAAGGEAGMIPMETQVLMQEVLTDGMAFCSLM